MTMTFKYSYYDNGVYIISNEEVANLKQVEITQDFLSEYEYSFTRHFKYTSTENIKQVLYSEIMDLPEVKETIQEAKDNGFQDVVIFIQSTSKPYNECKIFNHKLHKIYEYVQIAKIMGII